MPPPRAPGGHGLGDDLDFVFCGVGSDRCRPVVVPLAMWVLAPVMPVVDLNSVGARICAAKLTSLANQARIAESRAILARAIEAIDRLQSTPGTVDINRLEAEDIFA